MTSLNQILLYLNVAAENLQYRSKIACPILQHFEILAAHQSTGLTFKLVAKWAAFL